MGLEPTGTRMDKKKVAAMSPLIAPIELAIFKLVLKERRNAKNRLERLKLTAIMAL